MKILIACEESQTVCKAFRKLGHEAYSCDILPCSGGHPEWHIQGDAIKEAYSGKYDMMIAHPPCTYLSYAGIRWFNIERYGDKAIQRHKDKDEAIIFFKKLLDAPIKKICVENPRGFIMKEVKPSQLINPWQFGDRASKPTLLWLKNLPKLEPTNIVDKGEFICHTTKSGKIKCDAKWYSDAFRLSPAERSKVRSKTFQGIADAMAEQWGGINNLN